MAEPQMTPEDFWEWDALCAAWEMEVLSEIEWYDLEEED